MVCFVDGGKGDVGNVANLDNSFNGNGEMVVPQCAPKALALIRGLGSPINSHVRCFTSSAGKQF
jgi:hypothetical protein